MVLRVTDNFEHHDASSDSPSNVFRQRHARVEIKDTATEFAQTTTITLVFALFTASMLQNIRKSWSSHGG